MRRRISNFARTFVGSHYLWGSAGATPGQLDGSRYRRGEVPWAHISIKPASPCIYAAQCDVSGHYVCAGRFRKASGQIAAATDVHLTTYLGQFENETEAMWGGFYSRLTPRMIQGSGIEEAGSIVWGENCFGVRHFDCISFINYVLTETTVLPDQDKGWTGSIEQYARMWATDVDLGAAAQAGDILIRTYKDEAGQIHYPHIAFLAEDGFVVQAERAVMGVHADERYNPARWQIRRRLENKYIPADMSNYA